MRITNKFNWNSSLLTLNFVNYHWSMAPHRFRFSAQWAWHSWAKCWKETDRFAGQKCRLSSFLSCGWASRCYKKLLAHLWARWPPSPAGTRPSAQHGWSSTCFFFSQKVLAWFVHAVFIYSHAGYIAWLKPSKAIVCSFLSCCSAIDLSYIMQINAIFFPFSGMCHTIWKEDTQVDFHQ